MSNTEKNPSQNSGSPAKPTSPEGNAKLAGAKEALKDKLLKAVLQQAVQELGSPQAIAESLLEQASKAPQVEDASKSLSNLVISEIESQSLNGFSNAETTAASIFEKIRERDSVIPETVNAIRAKIIGDIYSKSIESVSDQDSLTNEVYDSIDADKAGVGEAVSRVRSKLLDEISSRAAESVSDFEAVASQLSEQLGSETSIVDPILDQIRVLMLNRISERAVSALQDAEEVARTIASTVQDSDDVIVHAVEALRQKLLGNVEGAALDSVRDPNSVADEIKSGFDSTPKEVTSGIDELRNRLVDDIMTGGLESISNPHAAAGEARAKIADSDERIASARDLLKSNLLEEVTNSAISELNSHVESTSGLSLSSADLSEIDLSGDSEIQLSDEPVAAFERPETADAANSNENGFGNQEWSNDVAPENEMSIADSDQTEPANDEFFADDENEVVAEHGSDDTFTEVSFDEDDVVDLDPIEQPFDSVLAMTDSSDGTEIETVIDDSVVATDTVLPDQTQPPHNPDHVAFYVYGIASESEVSTGAAIPESGIDPNAAVEQVTFGGLTAFVSQVQIDEFSGSGFKTRLQDKVWLKEKVKLHSHVLDTINDGRTVIPMRFCTVYRNDEEVSQLLSTNREHYLKVLEKISGKREWSVRIYRDEEKLAAKVAQSDRLVEDSLGSISKGVVHFVKEEMDRLNKIGGEQAIELMSQHCSSRSHAALMDCAADGLFKPTLGENGEPGSDIVLNAAYLVKVGEEDKIRDEVDRLASEYTELGFRFEVHGPWPPYHFATEPRAPRAQAVSA